MEKEDIRSDDFLGNLIRQVPLESPSGDFVDRVMSAIQPEAVATEKKKSYFYLQSALPYIALGMFCLLIFFTSDLPFLNNLSGKGSVLNEIIRSMAGLFKGIAASLDSKYISWGLLVGIAGGLLFFVDRFFSRRTAI